METIETKGAKAGQYLTFFINSQLYGVAIEAVREINRVGEVTPVPRTPNFVAGVTNLRGKIIPVINLRMKLNFEPVEHTKETCVIVIETGSGLMGMIVDAVSAVTDLSPTQIEPVPNLGSDKGSDYVLGIGKMEKGIIVLIDIVRALSDSQRADLASMVKDMDKHERQSA